MTSTALRHKLYDYISIASDKKLNAIYNLLEDEIKETYEWQKDKSFTQELDRRYAALNSGEDKGFTVDELKSSIEKHKRKKHGK